MFEKEAFLSCAEVLFDDLKNKCAIILRIKNMPVSPRTVERLISDMTTDVTKQSTVALKATNVFSIDINDNPHLVVVARYCSNGEVHKELCCLKSMCGTTKGKDITKNFEERGFDIKIFSIATDSAPLMMGQHRGFVSFVEQKIGHPVINLQCIIHLENLCGKISNSALNDVMSTVTKIVSLLVACFATTHRKFRPLPEEMKSTYYMVKSR